jgi:hypothetical protein
MHYFYFKDDIKKAIIEKYGSFKDFSEVYGIEQSHLSLFLNGSKNTTLNKINKILDFLDLELCVKRKTAQLAIKKNPDN